MSNFQSHDESKPVKEKEDNFLDIKIQTQNDLIPVQTSNVPPVKTNDKPKRDIFGNLWRWATSSIPDRRATLHSLVAHGSIVAVATAVVNFGVVAASVTGIKTLLIAATTIIWCNSTDCSGIVSVTVPTASVPFSLPNGRSLKYITQGACSDSNGGTNPTTDAWCTPNHAMNCGDVIIVTPGTGLSFGGDGVFGTVSNCPSTTGGIDGTGGIYFAILLCGGSDVMSCQASGGAFEAFAVNTSHWAVEGFWGTQNNDGRTGCFGGLNQSTPTQLYVAFVNNIASVCDLHGFYVAGGGGGVNTSFDYAAFVGLVAFNTAISNNAFCGSGISPQPGVGDSVYAGTHIFISGYFGAYNSNATGTCTAGGSPPHSDGEGIIFDTWGGGYSGGYTKSGVITDVVIWKSGGPCIEFFPNSVTHDLAQYTVQNATCFDNNQDTQAFCSAEYFYNRASPSATGSTNISNSIFHTNSVSGCVVSSVPVTQGAWVSSTAVSTSPPITISGNYFWSSKAPTHSTAVQNNVFTDGSNSGWPWGTNTYADPGLTSPTTLFSTTPDCTGYDNVTSCMNSKFSVYAKVTPTVAPTSMGYQPPKPCSPNALYPTWLKGIVYLHYTSSSQQITQRTGLINKPCDM